jgi:phosphoserine phosphatase
MNVYDFDKTVFYPDSSACFLRYCLRHYPRAVLKALPGASVVGLRWLMKQCETKELKEQLFSFLPLLESVEQTVADFWAEYRKNLAPWYLDRKQPDDLILSASPEFLLRPVCEELGIRLLATDMDPYTGKIHGLNCHDEEKLRRFRKAFPGERVERFYSDSLSDAPMARTAAEAFLVKNGELLPWPDA